MAKLKWIKLIQRNDWEQIRYYPPGTEAGGALLRDGTPTGDPSIFDERKAYHLDERMIRVRFSDGTVDKARLACEETSWEERAYTVTHRFWGVYQEWRGKKIFFDLSELEVLEEEFGKFITEGEWLKEHPRPEIRGRFRVC